jgi:hypothetical protein
MVNSMTECSLSRLYRRMVSQPATGTAELLDAETLVAASAGSLKGDRRNEVAARLSRSPLQTDLVRLLRDLAAEAETLAGAVGERQGHAHSRDSRGRRHAPVARRHVRHLRWAGLAACLMLVFGAVLWHPGVDESGISGNSAQSSARPDRIFTSKDRIFAMVDERAAPDAVFHTDFNGG